MEHSEHLSRLKALKINRGDGPLFKTEDECMEWIDNVAPLLKYDESHYEQFMAHSQYARITTLSADTLMAHLNPMIGILNQAIIELESGIETATNNSAKNPADSIPVHTNWHNMPLGKIAIGVIILVIGAVVLWNIKHYLGISL